MMKNSSPWQKDYNQELLPYFYRFFNSQMEIFGRGFRKGICFLL